MNTVSALMEYYKSNNSTNDELTKALDLLGPQRLNVVVLDLLRWLEYQHRGGHRRPLQLREDWQWCNDLVTLMNDHGCFQDVFVLDKWTINFRADIEDSERTKLLQIVSDGYKPRMFG